MNEKDSLGMRLREAREAKGLSGKGFASKVGVSSATVSRWESNADHPSGRHLKRISDVLGLPLALLLEHEAQQVQTRAPKGVSVSDPDAIRRLMEFAHLVVTTPGFKDILLGHAWAAEDRKVVSEVIAAVEEQTD